MERAGPKIELELRELLGRLGERPVSRLHVALHEPLVAVVREVRLSEAERELVRRGRSEIVREARREFSAAVCDHYREVIERATGRRLRSTSSDLSLGEERSWVAETFVVDDAAA
ncbi:MAG: Na-translocating system protein MpsC family protein [Solirubrobacterales bacterium]